MITLSILIPTYNRKDYLTKCLESIDYDKGLEIIISDNGSNYDVSSVIPKRLSNVTKAFKRKNNVGPRINVGQISEYASGKYLYYITDDDQFLPDNIKNLVKILEESDFDIGFHHLKIQRIISNKETWFGSPAILSKEVAARIRGQVLTGCIVKKEFHDRVYENKKNEIYQAWYHIIYLMAYTKNIKNINKVMAVHIWENETYWGMEPSQNTKILNESKQESYRLAVENGKLTIIESGLLSWLEEWPGNILLRVVLKLGKILNS